MKIKWRLSLLFLLLTVMTHAQIAFQAANVTSSDQAFQSLEQAQYNRSAQLPGNFDFSAFANRHLSYPTLARTYGIEGVVRVKVNVSPSGKTQFVKIVQSLGYGCDEQAIKMTAHLPDFIPAVFRGRKISSNVILEIGFKM